MALQRAHGPHVGAVAAALGWAARAVTGAFSFSSTRTMPIERLLAVVSPPQDAPHMRPTN
jgi:hypothetical protein